MIKSQKLFMNIRLIHVEDFGGKEVYLERNKIYKLLISYPFDTAKTYSLKVSGRTIGFITLLDFIYKSYKKHYKKYGEEAYHSIGDLFVEGIEVNHITGDINLSMGS